MNAEFFQFPAKTIKSFVLSSWLGKFPVAIAIGVGSKASFSISRDLVGEIPTSYITKVKARATELNNKNIYVLQIGASLYYKLGQLCFTNEGNASLLQISASVVTNWDSYYKLGQPLLQNRAAITNWDKMYYKSGQVLKIREIITNWGR